LCFTTFIEEKKVVRMIKAEQLSHESFEPFGSFVNPLDCGNPLGGEGGSVLAYSDRILQQFTTSNYIAYTPLVIRPRRFEITVTEIHKNSEEVFGGFNCDMCFHVAPPWEGDVIPPVSEFRVFHLPAGWWVRLKRGVWHHGPFVIGTDIAVGMAVLPPYTYTNDSSVVTLEEPIEIDI
jgi:ureidoglycolate hydrolase